MQTTSTIATSAPPSVNLLPPEIAEAAKFRRYQLAMAGVVVIAAVAVGFLYVGAKHDVSTAKASISTAQAQQAQFQSEVNALQSVSAAYSQVGSAKQLLAQADASEVHWSYSLNDLSLRIPDSVWLTSFSIAETGPPAAATLTVPGVAAAPSVITPVNQIGTISFSGDALARDDVAKWLNAIAAEHGWVDPYVTSITEAEIGQRKVYTFTGTVDATSPLLVHAPAVVTTPTVPGTTPTTATSTQAGS